MAQSQSWNGTVQTVNKEKRDGLGRRRRSRKKKTGISVARNLKIVPSFYFLIKDKFNSWGQRFSRVAKNGWSMAVCGNVVADGTMVHIIGIVIVGKHVKPNKFRCQKRARKIKEMLFLRRFAFIRLQTY